MILPSKELIIEMYKEAENAGLYDKQDIIRNIVKYLKLEEGIPASLTDTVQHVQEIVVNPKKSNRQRLNLSKGRTSTA